MRLLRIDAGLGGLNLDLQVFGVETREPWYNFRVGLTVSASQELNIYREIPTLFLTGILLLPLPADLPVAGHRMLAILAFAVVVWITEAVS